MNFFNDLAAKEQVTIIGIMLTLIVGIINIFVSTHRIRSEIVTQNRMKWIDSVRSLTGDIVSWRPNGSLTELRRIMNKLILLLNISSEIDNKVTHNLLLMFDAAYKLSFYSDYESSNARKLYEEYYDCKQNVNTLMRIYLKKEWTRIKVESRVWRIPFYHYWIPFFGFNEKWATRSLMKKYEKVKSYEFKPWITLEIDESMNVSGGSFGDEISMTKSGEVPSELGYYRRIERQQLAERLREGSPVIVVPDGKLAGVPEAHGELVGIDD